MLNAGIVFIDPIDDDGNDAVAVRAKNRAGGENVDCSRAAEQKQAVVVVSDSEGEIRFDEWGTAEIRNGAISAGTRNFTPTIPLVVMDLHRRLWMLLPMEKNDFVRIVTNC